MAAYMRPYSRLDRDYLRELREWRSGRSRNYRKFLILASPRSGSSWLVDLLRHHSALCVYGEVFNPNRIFTLPMLGSSDSPKILAVRDLFPARFAREYVFRGYEHEVRAVGLKIFYSDLERVGMGRLWNYLKADSALRVIHLFRRNLLQALVSDKIARETGHWRSHRSETTITLTQREYFKKALEFSKKYSDRLRAHKVLEIHYEDLLADVGEATTQALDFLQVTRVELESGIGKQEHRPISQSIANYTEWPILPMLTSSGIEVPTGHER